MPAEIGTSADADLSPLLLTVPDVAAPASAAGAMHASPLKALIRGWLACTQSLRAVFYPQIPWHSWQVQLGILAVCLILVSGASLILATIQEIPSPTADLTVTREYPDSGKVRAVKSKKNTNTNSVKMAVPQETGTDSSTTGSTRTALATDADLTPAEVNSASYQSPPAARDGAWLEGIIEIE